jgi:hypothetical protein
MLKPEGEVCEGNCFVLQEFQSEFVRYINLPLVCSFFPVDE